jgi:hypothetical protein
VSGIITDHGRGVKRVIRQTMMMMMMMIAIKIAITALSG